MIDNLFVFSYKNVVYLVFFILITKTHIYETKQLIITNRINDKDCCSSTSQASPQSLFRMGGYIGLCVSVIYSIHFSSFMTYHCDCIRSKTTGVISEAGIAYPSRAPEFIPDFLWDSCCVL